MEPAEYRTLNQSAIDQPQTLPPWCKCDGWMGNRRIIVLNGSGTGLMIYPNNLQEKISLPKYEEFPILTPSEEPINSIYGHVIEPQDSYHQIETALGTVYLAKKILNKTSEYFAKLDKFKSTTPKITDLRHMSYPLLQTALLVLIKAERFFSLGDPCSILEVCDFFCSPLLDEKLVLLFKHAFKNYELNTEEDVNTLIDILKDSRIRARPKIQELLFSIIHKFIDKVINEHQSDFGMLENLIMNWPQELPRLRVSLDKYNVRQVSKISHLIENLSCDVSDSTNALLFPEVAKMNHLKRLVLWRYSTNSQQHSMSKIIECFPKSLEYLSISDYSHAIYQTECLDKLTQMPHLKQFSGHPISSSQSFLKKLPQDLEEILIGLDDFNSNTEQTLIGDFSRFKQLKVAIIFSTISNENLQNLPHTIEILFALCSAKLTQEGIAKLSHLPHLKELVLHHNSACPSTADPYDFSSLKAIQLLSISITTFSSSLVNRFPSSCQQIRLIYLKPKKKNVDHGNESINSPTIAQGSLLPNGSLSNQDVIHATDLLKQMPYLKKLSFSEWELTDNFISFLPKNLETLFLKASKNLTDQCAEDLYQMKELRQLNINGCNLTDQAIEKLPDSIEELSINKCQHITTAIAPKLSAMPNLKRVACSKELSEKLEDLLPPHIELIPDP